MGGFPDELASILLPNFDPIGERDVDAPMAE